MDDLLNEFLTETNENLAVLDNELIKLEQNPNDPALLSNIFRTVHTIKGTCGFLGLPRLEAVAHASENILGKFRDQVLQVTPYSVTLILASLDRIKSLLLTLEQTGKEPDGTDQELIDQLNAHANGEDADVIAPPAAVASAAAPAAPIASAAAEPEPDEHGFVPMTADQLAAQMAASVAAAPEPAAAPTPAAAPAASEEIKPAVTAPAPAAAPTAQAAAPAASGESALAAQTLRVNADVLEDLMTTVSELVLIRNQMLQILRGQKDTEFASPLQRLNHVTSDLQEQVMKTRMQPIGNAWSKLPRIVRDLANELGKKIDLQMIGAETELDRQVLEMIKDPLTHMVRNSADHGLEGPADRLASGKRETGTITLNAYHEGGHIIIEINDDGRGLNTAKIKEKIIKSGLASEAELAAMSDQQIHMFIFRAGFSTAAAVTSVSGRGVGMDVVRTNIEKIGGTIDMRSIEGKGTRFSVKIPLTLAIVSALIVESSGERFAIPQISVLELVRAGGSQGENTIEHIKGAPVLRLRNRLLPLLTLRDVLKLDKGPQATSTVTDLAASRDSIIVVTQVGSQTFGIIVDRVFDTEEIVVKPVAPILRDIEIFSGNTILGDGSVIMILDPNGIANSVGSQAGATEAATAAIKSDDNTQHTSSEKLPMLLFRAGDAAPKAVPLSLVARLEDVEVAQIEYSHGQAMVQYRGRLMPLLSITDNFKMADTIQPVLVFADRDRSMGLMVDEIVDIVEERLDIQIGSENQGFMGSAIIAGKSTDIVDAGFFLTKAFRDWFGSTESYGGKTGSSSSEKVLLVDDSSFFRNMLTPLLTVSGYSVTTVDNAGDALRLCQEGNQFDIIVSDIEMPGMSGFEFVETLRKDERWQNVPVIALSSHATPVDLDRGRKAGFSNHVAKFDRQALLSTLSKTLEHKGAA